MKNYEIYSQKKYDKLLETNRFYRYLKIFHTVILYSFIFILTFYNIMFRNNTEGSFKFIIIFFFILHFHWEIFKGECIFSYMQKKKNKSKL